MPINREQMICVGALGLLLLTCFFALTFSLQARSEAANELAQRRDVLSPLEARARTGIKGTAGRTTAAPAAAFLQAASAGIAAAQLQSYLSQVAGTQRATLISYGVEPAGREDSPDSVRIQTTLDISQTALQGLLYALESRTPYVFIDANATAVDEAGRGHRPNAASHVEPACAAVAGAGMMSHAWIAVGFALGSFLMIAAAVVATAEAQTKDQAQLTAPVPALISPLAEYSLDRLSATRERPLFSPNRRPPPPPAVIVATRPPPAPPPNVTVLGIIMDADEARAIVQTGGSEVRRVRIGDDIGGWKVVQIDQRLLVLSLDNRSASFTMFGSPALGSPNDAAPKAPAKHREAAPAMQAPVQQDRRGD
jgi:general secretion pathway protein N